MQDDGTEYSATIFTGQLETSLEILRESLQPALYLLDGCFVATYLSE